MFFLLGGRRGEKKFQTLAVDTHTRENLVDPASNICLDEGLSHANVRISRLRQICGRLSKKGRKKEGKSFVDNEGKSFNNTKIMAMKIE